MYETLEVDVEVEQQESNSQTKTKKTFTQTKLIGKGQTKALTEKEVARSKLKRKFEEAKKDRVKIKYNKKKKVTSTILGNMGYINDFLLAQLMKIAKNKLMLTNLIEKTHENFIDHLSDTYRKFWSEHVEDILKSGIGGDALEVYNRKSAVT